MTIKESIEVGKTMGDVSVKDLRAAVGNDPQTLAAAISGSIAALTSELLKMGVPTTVVLGAVETGVKQYLIETLFGKGETK